MFFTDEEAGQRHEVRHGLNKYATDVSNYTRGSVTAFPQIQSELLRNHYFRSAWVKRFAWAVPSKSAVTAIVAGGPVVEIGAGTGYWSMLLRHMGCDVLAYDRTPYENDWCSFTWSEVNQGSAETAAAHSDRSLFLCWPPYNTPMASAALAAYKGNRLYYIGEGYGGCTGDDQFHGMLVASWSQPLVISLPQFSGIGDNLFVYERVR